MNISADFGITVTDTLRRKNDELIHRMDLSSDNLNHDRVREIFPDIDFNSNTGFLAVTGGRHLELGANIDNTPIIHWLPESMAAPAALVLEEDGLLVTAAGLLEDNSYPEGTIVQLERMGFAILEGLDQNGARMMPV